MAAGAVWAFGGLMATVQPAAANPGETPATNLAQSPTQSAPEIHQAEAHGQTASQQEAPKPAQPASGPDLQDDSTAQNDSAGQDSPAPAQASSRPRVSGRTAANALDEAAAAYEYGDMNLVVAAAREVVDGALPSTEADRLDALYFLGISLFLTGRSEGARTAFVELLALRPTAQLDPNSVRPEVVAFFSELKRQRIAELVREQQSRVPALGWSFLPPVGQFKNGDDTRGWFFLGAQVTFAATALALATWLRADCGTQTRVCKSLDPNTAEALQVANYAAAGLFAATYTAGVLDSILGRNRATEHPVLSIAPGPGGLVLHASF